MVVTILTDKIVFKSKKKCTYIIEDREGGSIMIKGSTREEDITIIHKTGTQQHYPKTH